MVKGDKPEVEAQPNYDDVPAVAEAEGGAGWHPELPRVEFTGLLGKQLVFLETEERESSYSTPEKPKTYTIMRAVCPGKALTGIFEDESVVVDAGAEFTASTGRVRVCEQLDKATLPSKGEVSKGNKSSGGFDIWELVPWS